MFLPASEPFLPKMEEMNQTIKTLRQENEFIQQVFTEHQLYTRLRSRSRDVASALAARLMLGLPYSPPLGGTRVSARAKAFVQWTILHTFIVY